MDWTKVKKIATVVLGIIGGLLALVGISQFRKAPVSSPAQKNADTVEKKVSEIHEDLTAAKAQVAAESPQEVADELTNELS